MQSLRYLFMDFNAFFAAVEQHDDLSARGRPVIVAPTASEHTMAIAASYEARPFGIKRGTGIREARQLCPDVIVRPARHDRYVQVHKLLKQEVERHLPISHVYSIDEWVCVLAPSERSAASATALAERIRRGITRNLSPALRVSIGLAPTPLLAKLAAERMKPDGLTILDLDDLPDKLVDIDLTDIPGIGKGVARRLERAGVTSFRQLWNLQPKHARKIWGSVQGERFWYRLHGYEVPEQETTKSMIGHSRVLSREHEPPEEAHKVARALMLKAASRLRHYERFAGALTLGVRMRGSRSEHAARFDASRRFRPAQDTFLFGKELDAAWREFLHALPSLHDANGGHRIGGVTVYLHGLCEAGDLSVQQGDLFANPQKDRLSLKRASLWSAIDRINADMDAKMRRLGQLQDNKDAEQRYVTLASQQSIDLKYLGAKIAFSRVPEEAEFLF